MSANLTCRLQEDQEVKEEEEEEDLQQPVSVLVAVGGNGRATQILRIESRHTINAKNFNIHHYSVEGQELKVQLDVRRWILVGFSEEKR